MKTCTKCKIEKPESEFSRHANKKDGLQTQCKKCVSEYRSANSKKIAEQKRRYREENRERVSEYERKYRDDNRERRAEYMRRYYAENKEYFTEHNRSYYIKNRDILSEYDKQRYADNRVKRAEYRKENRDRYAAHSRNRRAMAKHAEGTHTAADIRNLLDLQRHKCAYCNACVKGGYHVDHIVALVNGGGNGRDNLQILCPHCNLSKQSRCPIEFAQKNHGLLL